MLKIKADNIPVPDNYNKYIYKGKIFEYDNKLANDIIDSNNTEDDNNFEDLNYYDFKYIDNS